MEAGGREGEGEMRLDGGRMEAAWRGVGWKECGL